MDLFFEESTGLKRRYFAGFVEGEKLPEKHWKYGCFFSARLTYLPKIWFFPNRIANVQTYRFHMVRIKSNECSKMRSAGIRENGSMPFWQYALVKHSTINYLSDVRFALYTFVLVKLHWYLFWSMSGGGGEEHVSSSNNINEFSRDGINSFLTA